MTLRQTERSYDLDNDVGVVVIGRNEGQRLIDCLKSIHTETFATVYVDSGSTDNSVAAAERLGATVVNLNMSAPFTAARARNEGFRTLKALNDRIRFVQFIDGDCTLNAYWLSSALDFIAQRDDIAAVCGRLRERYPDASIYNWLCDVEWDSPAGEILACGGIVLIRSKALECVDGFNGQLIAGEEPELCLRLRHAGWKIWRLETDMACHDAAITMFSQWWWRSVRSGYAYASVFHLHAGSPPTVWRREILRAILWAAVLPLVTLFAAFKNPMGILLVTAYPLQIIRIATQRGVLHIKSWYYATFITLSKFSEFQGIVKYFWGCWRKKKSRLIEYK